MPVCSAVPLELTAAERHRIKKMAYGHKTPHQARQRATIVLLAARGRSNARIAAEAHLHVDTVRRWRGRFAPAGCPPWPTASGRGGLRRSPRCRSPKSRRACQLSTGGDPRAGAGEPVACSSAPLCCGLGSRHEPRPDPVRPPRECRRLVPDSVWVLRSVAHRWRRGCAVGRVVVRADAVLPRRRFGPDTPRQPQRQPRRPFFGGDGGTPGGPLQPWYPPCGPSAALPGGCSDGLVAAMRTTSSADVATDSSTLGRGSAFGAPRWANRLVQAGESGNC
jgi:hypothetical protein